MFNKCLIKKFCFIINIFSILITFQKVIINITEKQLMVNFL